MKNRNRLVRGITALPALVALAWPRAARAQADVNLPLPNFLLLVDTSGSMEYKVDGTLPTCNAASTASLNERSRWIDLVEVLSGTIDNYTCENIDRTAVAFKTGEYALGGTPPYDYLYPLAYHRPLSNGCAPAPGVQSSNPFIYPAGAIGHHIYNSATTCTTFSQQAKDGILDAYKDAARFALMTFDTSTNAGTGYTGTMAAATANAATGKAGLWSYEWSTVPTGAPAGCATTSDQDVGARNGAAPAWEGRLVNFGNPYDAQLAYPIKNDHIQEVMRATRPYGATPIAGMLQDAADFLLKDTSKDPDRYPTTLASSDIAADFGPYEDPFLQCGRNQTIILLTDGQPNMDLRPYCRGSETPAGVCPFNKPEEIAAALFNASPSTLTFPTTTFPAHKSIRTFVVGFALDQVDHDNNSATAAKDCATLTAAEVDASSTTSLCGNPANASNAPLQACCTLQRIALAGGTDGACFATDKTTVISCLGKALGGGLTPTSRTQAVLTGTSGSSGNSSNGGQRFFSSFVPQSTSAWEGRLDRQRITCDDASAPGTPTPQLLAEDKGDYFERNVALGGPDVRRIYTVLGGATVSDPLKSASTIRPLIGSDKDGAGAYGGRYFSGNSRYFVDNLPTGATAIPTTSCFNQKMQVLSAAACQKQVLEWWAGYNNGQSSVLSRCVGAPICRLLGDIVHSTPAVVDRPLASIRDESFTAFSYQQRLRPKVLYTSTNDGMLHAFKVASNDQLDAGNAAKEVLTKVNNELWSFVPPAVLPNLYSLYPHAHQVLLDGIPTVMNVVAQPSSSPGSPPTVFERSKLAAQQGSAVWRTVLVQGFGKLHSGYFALDVTNPVPDTSNPDDVTKGGPRLLWQLTTDKLDKNIFGNGGGTPTITTLFFDPLGGSNVSEIPVAILPGGPGGTVDTSGTGCPTGGRTYTDVTLDSSYPPRSKVRCYTYPTGDIGARSLTIVRLDTGEIIRTFRQSKTELGSELWGRVTEVPIDSPIVGQPVAFPGFTGEVADRIFVGDNDGRLWRLNVASPNPADWTMKLFMDLYPASSPSDGAKTYAQGQPITNAPVVSVDTDNNLVLNVATGDQDSLGPAPGQWNFVYSLTEKVNAAHTALSTKVNWYFKLADGKRVVGPMVLFNSQLFFGTFAGGSPSNPCDIGTSEIWGMDYLRPLGNSTSVFNLGGEAFIVPPATTASQLIQSVSSAVAFGPALTQKPSCATDIDTLLGDGLVGFGHQVSLSNIQSGTFQLVFQTGSQMTGSVGGGTSVGVRTINLASPPALSSVSAWASIVE